MKSLKQREKEKKRQLDKPKNNYGISASKLAVLKESLNKSKRKVVSPVSEPNLNPNANPNMSSTAPPPPLPSINSMSVTNSAAVEEEDTAETKPSLGVHDALPPLKRPLKRARVRKRTVGDSSIVGGLDLNCPESTVTSWNASEVIKNFLYIGAGRDQNQRCLVNRPMDSKEIKAEVS